MNHVPDKLGPRRVVPASPVLHTVKLRRVDAGELFQLSHGKPIIPQGHIMSGKPPRAAG